VRTYAGDPVPERADALVGLGGGMNVRDQHLLRHLGDELRLLRRCISEGRPVLGICLGSQLLATALGGSVGRAERKEIGFYRVRLTEAARNDPLFSGSPHSFVAFHWHGDVFTLPENAVPLASSTQTPLQAFRAGERAWGIQFHLEVDDDVLAAMMGGEAELREEGVDPELLRLSARRELPRLSQVAAGVFGRFAALAAEAGG
jgi:GMP synthase (glutamine-hydrolysing)